VPAVVIVKMGITPSMLVVLLAATPPCLLKLVATLLRLTAVLTVFVNCFSEILLGVVDTLTTVTVVIGCPCERTTANQQPYSKSGNEQNVHATFYPTQHRFLLNNRIWCFELPERAFPT
jgi:hypothetical protein